MSPFQALVMGIIQGLGEFLPISSSAHLTLAPWLFHWDDPGLGFDVALHVGTLVAVLWYFRAEWARLIHSAISVISKRRADTDEERRVIYLAIATVPGGIAGLLLEKQAEHAFRDPRLIASVLIVMGIILWIVDKSSSESRALGEMSWKDALLIGLAQMFAIVPGVSRSGSTITAGRALKLTREGAAIFSFLMSMPIIAAAALLKVPHVLKTEGLSTPLLIGVVASAVSGWIAISVLLRFVVTRSYGIFAMYRVVVGLIVLYIAYRR
ncbi:MAG: undecaprenyl-diphosphatase UppP [Gemmatimonadaceae bacterium]